MVIIFSIEVVLAPKLSFYQLIIPRDVFEDMNDSPGESIIIGAHFNGEPIGIVIAKIQSSQFYANLHYIHVRSKFRRFGIGNNLLKELEQNLLEKDCKKIYSWYLYHEYSRDLEAFFYSCGFNTLTTDMLYYQTCITRNDNNAPLFRRSELPPDFSIFLWSDLTDAERKIIQEGENFWYPDNLSPLINEVEYKTSIGLRFQGEVVGWMITKITPFQTLEYATLFIQERFQKLGVGITLIVKAIELQQSELCEVPIMNFRVASKNQNMLAIVEHKLGKYLELEKKERKRVTKQLIKLGVERT